MKDDLSQISQYEDIINLPHHRSKTHPHMTMHDRAAQFSPFAALTGFEGAIAETGRLTDQRIELDELTKAALDEKFKLLQKQLSSQPKIQITYFQPDEKKSGGAYVRISGKVKKIDQYQSDIIMQDGTRISISEITEITGEIFTNIDDHLA